MKYARNLFILAVLLLVPSAAWAQQKAEVSGFVGWRHGNDLFDEPTGLRIDINSGATFGFIFDVALTDSVQAEFIYSYRSAAADVTVPPAIGPQGMVEAAPVNVDYFHGGILYHFAIRGQPQLRPFIVGTLGATNLRPESSAADSTTRFSWGGGIGLKYFVNRNIGVRTEYRLFATNTDFVNRGVYCDIFGFCYVLSTSAYLFQSQFAAAVVIGF